MNRVSGFIIIITGALVRISEYHIILYILIKSRYTAVQYCGTQPKYCGILRYNTAVRSLNTAVYRGTKFSAALNTIMHPCRTYLYGRERQSGSLAFNSTFDA